MDSGNQRERPSLLDLQIELEKKKIQAAELKKAAEERTRKVKQIEQYVNTCKMKLNHLAIIKNNVIRTHNSLIESDRAAKEMEQSLIKQMESVEKELVEKIKLAEEKLAQLPTEAELKRFVEDKMKLEQIEKETFARLEHLKDDKSDEAAELGRELAEKVMEIESLRDELKKSKETKQPTKQPTKPTKPTKPQDSTKAKKPMGRDEFLDKYFGTIGTTAPSRVTSTKNDSEDSTSTKPYHDDSSYSMVLHSSSSSSSD